MKIIYYIEKNVEITEIERFWGQRAWDTPTNHLKLKFGRTPPAAPADVIYRSIKIETRHEANCGHCLTPNI